MNEELVGLSVKEEALLEKFEGEPLPENLVERVHLVDGEIVKHEWIENEQVVRTENYEKGGDAGATN